MKSKRLMATDWRLTGQENYLKGLQLEFKTYFPADMNWDHDHCEFCGGKFSLKEGDIRKGYTTGKGYLWICENCYVDFRDEFEWEVE
jgi:Zn-finger protein